MTGFDIRHDRKQLDLEANGGLIKLLQEANGIAPVSPVAAESSQAFTGDPDQPNWPRRRRPLAERLREHMNDEPLGSHLKEKLSDLIKLAPKLKPLLDFITDIVDVKREGRILRDGKSSITIERKGASSIPLGKNEGPFKLTSVDLAEKISFDITLKDGLANIKGIKVNGEVLGKKTAFPIAGARLTTNNDGEPQLQVDIALDAQHPEKTIPILLPLNRKTDK